MSDDVKRKYIHGAPSTLSARPHVYHALTEKLLAEGWRYDMTVGEWVLEVRGRIAWKPDGTEAWLHHPAARGSVTLPPSTHHTYDPDAEWSES